MQENLTLEQCTQGTPEWLALRASKITATDAGCILGVDPYCSAYMRWKQKLGLISPQKENFAMLEGRRLEPIARNQFTLDTGIQVEPLVLINPNRPWQMASFDGVTVDRKIGVEIKCSSRIYEKALNHEIDDHYIAQVQHQIEVLGVDMIFFYAFCNGKGKLLRINRDESYINNMIDKEYEFWNRLNDFESPAMCDKDFIERYDDEWKDAVSEWDETNKIIKLYEEKESLLKKKIIQLAGCRNTTGFGVTASLISRKGNVNYADLCLENNIDPEKYRKNATENWRITSHRKSSSE